MVAASLHLYRLGVEITLLAKHLGYLIVETIVGFRVGRADEDAREVAGLGKHAAKALVDGLHILGIQLVATHAENEVGGPRLLDVVVEGRAAPCCRGAAIPGHGVHRVAALLAVVVETVCQGLHHGVADEEETLCSGVGNQRLLFHHGQHGGVGPLGQQTLKVDLLQHLFGEGHTPRRTCVDEQS